MEAKTIAEEEEQKKCNFEVVEVPLTIKLPKPYLEFLEHFAKMLNMTVEAILKDELYSTLSGFFSNGFLEGWINNYVIDGYVNGDKGKQLQAMIDEIDC